MSESTGAAAVAAADAQEEQAKTPGDHIGTILVALADALHETVSRFEETAGGVTHLVAKPVNAGPNKDLVVTLQNFDRLQQEFAALAGVLKRYGGMTTTMASGASCPVTTARELIEGITVAEFRDRLLDRMPTVVGPSTGPDDAAEEEQVF